MAKWTAEARRDLPLSDFGEPGSRSFPIRDQADVDDAARLIGHAEDPEAVKRRIIKIAKRLGLSVPDSWKDGDKPEKSHGAVEYKTCSAFEIKATDKKQGIIECIVSVFNNVDQGRDRILPGFFAKSLRTKLPKGVWMHDWKVPVAKTLYAQELMPGDPRLPEQIRSLGGLYVKGQFNLDTQRGREAFSDLDFGTVDEFSIGYVSERDKVDSKTGVRDLIEGRLFEWSPVLIGMNSETSMISSKTHDADVKSDAMSEGSDDSGGATVPEDAVRAGAHVKWGAYARGMKAGCGTVKAVHTKGAHGGMEATADSPIARVAACKAMDDDGDDDGDEKSAESKCAGGCDGSCKGKGKPSAKCMETKTFLHHPVAKLTHKPGKPEPAADAEPDADEDDAPVPPRRGKGLGSLPASALNADVAAFDAALAKVKELAGLATKGRYLGNTDEVMASAAAERIHSILGYFLFSAIYSDKSPAEVADAVGGAIDEYKDTILGMLNSLLEEVDPDDATDPAMRPGGIPGIPIQEGAYGYRSLPMKYLAKLASLDTSADGAASTLSVETLSRHAASAIGELRDVGHHHLAVRVKEGRTLSAANRNRIATTLEDLRRLSADLESLLADAEPKPKAEAVPGDDAMAKAAALSLQRQLFDLDCAAAPALASVG